MKHQKYYQYYKDIRIEAAELSDHTDKEDWIRVMHGDILHGMKFTIENTISEKVAFSNALKHMGAETYAWEIKAPEEEVSIPEEELIFARINGPEIVPENFTLCNRFDIVSVKPHENKTVYVDAHSGEVVKSRSNIQGCNTTLKYGADGDRTNGGQRTGMERTGTANSRGQVAVRSLHHPSRGHPW